MGLSLGRMQTSNTSVRLSQATLELVPGVLAELDKGIGGTIRKVDFGIHYWNIMSFKCLLHFSKR